MKVLISVDAEGLQGITFGTQVLPGLGLYQEGKDAMTDSVNAVAEGAFKGGATSVTVVDSHDGNRNIPTSRIMREARLISGWPKELSMVEGARDADILFMIGYHSRAGTLNGILDHTYSTNVHRLWINRKETGEIGLSAAVAGKLGVRVGLVAGDAAAVNEAHEIFKDCEFAVLKKGLSRYSANSLSSEMALELLEASAEKAVKHHGTLYKVKEPVKVSVEFQNSGMADNCMLLPDVIRKDAYTVEIEGSDMINAYKLFRVLVSLSSFYHGDY
ncbi:MAG: M55 family metallopeptidase [Thermoplasmata archaeon]